MSDREHYDLESIAQVFTSFVGGFVDYALELRFGKGYPTEKLPVSEKEFSQIYGYENSLDNFFKMIRLHKSEIMDQVAEDIAEYMNFFVIETDKQVDEFKLIYFMGFKMAEILEGMGLTTEAKIILYASVIQLDVRLQAVTNGIGRPELKRRLREVIRKGEVQKRLGTNGIYLIYKCAYRMLQSPKK